MRYRCDCGTPLTIDNARMAAGGYVCKRCADLTGITNDVCKAAGIPDGTGATWWEETARMIEKGYKTFWARRGLPVPANEFNKPGT
jgi:hypothetical protein